MTPDQQQVYEADEIYASSAEAAQELARRLKARYNSHDHPHPDEPTLSTSKLVDDPAGDIARQLHAALVEGTYEEDTHFMGKPLREYTFLGDNLADAAFCEEDGWGEGEFRCELEMEPDEGETWTRKWMMRGHPDAWCTMPVAVDGTGPVEHVFFGEHKGHAETTERKEEKKRRQNLINLAIAWNAVREGETCFQPSEWRKLQEPWYWPEGARPGGSIDGTCTWYGPNVANGIPLGEVELDEVLRYYHDKGIAIIRAVETGDFSIADAWDRASEEFGDEILAGIPQGTLDELSAVALEAKKAKADAEAAYKKAMNDVRKHLESIGRWEAFEEEGKMSVCDDRLTLKLIQYAGRKSADVKSLEADGLTQYIREGKPYSSFQVA